MAIADAIAARSRPSLFDWAGTVVDFGSRAPVIAVMQTFDDLGVPITVDEARGPMGMAKRDHIHTILELPRVADLWRQVQGAAPTRTRSTVVYRAFLATQASADRGAQRVDSGLPGDDRSLPPAGTAVGLEHRIYAELMEPLVAGRATPGARVRRRCLRGRRTAGPPGPMDVPGERPATGRLSDGGDRRRRRYDRGHRGRPERRHVDRRRRQVRQSGGPQLVRIRTCSRRRISKSG